jgi:hypothetical protein
VSYAQYLLSRADSAHKHPAISDPLHSTDFLLVMGSAAVSETTRSQNAHFNNCQAVPIVMSAGVRSTSCPDLRHPVGLGACPWTVAVAMSSQ